MSVHVLKTRLRSPLLPGGITEKMLSFAESIVGGLSQADAYRAAFNTSNMKPKTIRDEASRLAQHPGVTAAIERLRAEKEAREYIARLSEEDRIWNSLWHLAENDVVPASVRVKALTLAAQMAGLLRTDRSQPLPIQTTGEIDAEIRVMLTRYTRQTEADLRP